MEEQLTRSGFDEIAKTAARYLLEQFWVLRDREPEQYMQIRNREQALRKWFLEKTGLRLIVHRYFAKLEKVPAEAFPWMGMQEFQQPRDYVLFCCLLAFLEGRAVEDQFLLSMLCEELVVLYPAKDELDWNNYEHRKALVRVMHRGAELGLLQAVDGEVDQFSQGDTEVLYEVKPVARYFLRSFSRGITDLGSPADILASELATDATDRRRHHIYRQLLFCPAMQSSGSQDADFLYLRNYRNRLRDDLEANFDLQFELYRNVAMLTLPERWGGHHCFPDDKTISTIAVQFAGLAREKREAEAIELQYNGSILLPPSIFVAWVAECAQRYASGWSKQYRELEISAVAKDLLNLLVEWQFASINSENGIISLLATLARYKGDYPADFTVQEGEAEDA